VRRRDAPTWLQSSQLFPRDTGLSVIIKRPAAALEHVRKPRSGAMLMVGLAIAMLVAVIAGYHYVIYSLFTGMILSAIHRVLRRR